MNDLLSKLDKEKFTTNLFNEISKLPFGSLPKVELELLVLHSIIEAQGGYEKLNEFGSELQRSLKLSQTKFKNKILEAQLRYDNQENKVEDYLRKNLLKNDLSELQFDQNENLVLYIANPLLLDLLKVYFDSNEIINDSSFNKSILSIERKGLLRILTKILDRKELENIEKEFKKLNKSKDGSFSLIGNVNIESIFSAEISLDPFKSAKDLILKARNIMSFKNKIQ
jgi:hypothetical protein